MRGETSGETATEVVVVVVGLVAIDVSAISISVTEVDQVAIGVKAIILDSFFWCQQRFIGFCRSRVGINMRPANRL